MAGFKKVVLTQTESAEMADNSSVMKQLDKFDNNYSASNLETSKKLENLYNEFDSITFNNTNTVSKDVSTVKEKAVSSAKVTIYLTCAILATLLLLFLAIYNVFVIQNLNRTCKVSSELQIEKSAELEALQQQNKELIDSVQNRVNETFHEIPDANRVNIDLINKVNVQNLQAEGNWFDALCNFLQKIFS